MSMAVNLTEAAITRMYRDDISSEDLNPVLQVIDMKLVQSQQHITERYALMLSDGSHCQQGILATQNNHLVASGNLQKGSVVKLTRFISHVVQNRKIIIVVELDVMLEKCNLIGDPVSATKIAPAVTSVKNAQVSLDGNSHDAGGMAARPNVNVQGKGCIFCDGLGWAVLPFAPNSKLGWAVFFLLLLLIFRFLLV